jgi:RNA polymerase sigma factor
MQNRLTIAKSDNNELERLISDYLPFIKETIRNIRITGVEYDDKLSLAMITFMNCVEQYEEDRGSFVAFADSCIRNRLKDESRRQMRHTQKGVSILNDEVKASDALLDKISIDAYMLKQEQNKLSEEIEALSIQLMDYNISFSELPLICPKQKRSRKQCIELGRFVAGNLEMRESLLKTRRLAQSKLAKRYGLSEKTIEKHRKYIVTIAVLLTGDYPYLRAFLPQFIEVKK